MWIFFRCLNCVPAPSYSLLFWLSFFSQHFFQLFVHVTSVCGFFVILTCGYILPLNCFLIHSINVFNKSFWKFPKIILGIKKIHSYNLNNFINIKHRTLKHISEWKKIHPPENLFHRITILIHKFQIWILFVWCNNHFDKGLHLLFSGIDQLICLNFYNWYSCH